MKCEDEHTQKEQNKEEDLRPRFFQTGQRLLPPSHRILFEKVWLCAA